MNKFPYEILHTDKQKSAIAITRKSYMRKKSTYTAFRRWRSRFQFEASLQDY